METFTKNELPIPFLTISNKTSIYDEDILQLVQSWRILPPQMVYNSKFEPYWFEHFDFLYWRKVVWEWPFLPYIACVLYLATIFGLERWMKDKAPFKLRRPLIIWNWALGIFSMMGAYRMGQEIGETLAKQNGLHRSICENKNEHYLPGAFWGLLFVLSKYIELGDTFFLVLKKQRILALQWYHHCLVTIFAWVLYSWQESILKWYSFVNYAVHSVMYTYFALRAMNVKVPEIFAMAITTIQVLQMIVGLGFNIYTIYIWGNGRTCARNPTSVGFSLLTYFSLLVMFAQFFVSKYVARTRMKNKSD